MPAAVLSEVENLVFTGCLSPDPRGHRFKLYDPFFRSVLAFWTEPTLDAQYFGIECIRALEPFQANGGFAQYDSISHLTDCVKPFALQHLEPGGAVRHALKAGSPSLYGSEVLLGVLSYIHFREGGNPRAERRRLDRGELQRVLGADRAQAFVDYLLDCELPTGGFRERSSSIGGVITTSRGMRMLEQLGVSPQYPQAHSRFLASCWILSGHNGNESSCMNRVGERDLWLSPTHYCLATIARNLSGEYQKYPLSRVVELADSITEFVRNCRGAEGGFAYAPGESASVAATWDAVRLSAVLRTLIHDNQEYAYALAPLRDASTIPPYDMLLFLQDQSSQGAFGWTKHAQPNLYAMMTASRLVNLLEGRVSERGRLEELAKQMVRAVLRFQTADNVPGRGLFQCYT